MADQASPRATILGITSQVPLARALALIVELGIADRIGAGAKTAAELATELHQNEDALYRLLRMLAAEQIFSEDESGRFQHTSLSRVLMTDADDSVASLLSLPWQDIVWATYLEMPHTIATGKPAFDKAHGQAFFDYLSANTQANALFDTVMALISGPEDAAVAQAFDFGSFGRVVDVGGGQGGLLAAIFTHHPGVKGVLFDQSQVLAEPRYLMGELEQRCELVAGDFFESVPSGGDVYVLKRIIHDWDDRDAIKLLSNCAAAMGATGRLLLAEAVMKPGNEPDPSKAQDVGMMLLTRGRERTADQYRELLDAAGLDLVKIHPAATSVSVLEARAKNEP
ncbi:MAG: methyltransferase [Gammaproteobacteria bacterium]